MASSIEITEITEADDVQNSVMLESSRPTTSTDIPDISKAEDKPNSESASSSPRSKSSEELQVNPIIEELKLDYPDIGHGYFNPFGEEIQNECPRLKKEFEDGKGKIPELLKSGDIQGAKEQVQQVLYRFHAIQYVNTVLLPMHRSTKVVDDIKESKVDMGENKQMKTGIGGNKQTKNGDGDVTTTEVSLLDLYRTLFTYALKDKVSKELLTILTRELLKSRYSKEDTYIHTEFMVFLVKKV